jgi:2-methylcitrate dehydratase PrpD
LAARAMAAVCASIARGAGREELARAIALALASADGRVSVPAERWKLFAQAIERGIKASDEAVTYAGALDAPSRTFLSAKAGHDGIVMDAFESVPDIAEIGFKPYPIARQGLNAVEAFQKILNLGIDPMGIESVDVFVPAANLALLTRPVSGEHRLTRLCNMGFQLACAAIAPETLFDGERIASPGLMAFAARVSVHADPALDIYLDRNWPARVLVKSTGRTIEETVIASNFDADAPGLSDRLTKKWARLAPEFGLAKPGISGLWKQIATHVRMAASLEG